MRAPYKSELTKRDRRRRWFWILLMVATAGVVVSAAIRFNALRKAVPTAFQATLHTRAIAIPFAGSAENAGIFNSATRRVDLTFTSREQTAEPMGVVFEGKQTQRLRCAANTRLRNVRLTEMSMGEERIALTAEQGHVLRYALSATNSTSEIYIKISVDRASDTRDAACAPDFARGGDGEWEFRPADENAILEFTLHDADGSKAKADAKDTESEEFTEVNLPLQSSLTLRSDGDLGSEQNSDQLLLLRTGRKLPLTHAGTVEFGNLQGSIDKLTYLPAKDLLEVSISGKATRIETDYFDMKRDMADRGYSKFRPQSITSSAGFLVNAACLLVSIVGLILTHRKKS
jgi:hypothetical protein